MKNKICNALVFSGFLLMPVYGVGEIWEQNKKCVGLSVATDNAVSQTVETCVTFCKSKVADFEFTQNTFFCCHFRQYSTNYNFEK